MIAAWMKEEAMPNCPGAVRLPEDMTTLRCLLQGFRRGKVETAGLPFVNRGDRNILGSQGIYGIKEHNPEMGYMAVIRRKFEKHELNSIEP